MERLSGHVCNVLAAVHRSQTKPRHGPFFEVKNLNIAQSHAVIIGRDVVALEVKAIKAYKAVFTAAIRSGSSHSRAARETAATEGPRSWTGSWTRAASSLPFLVAAIRRLVAGVGLFLSYQRAVNVQITVLCSARPEATLIIDEQRFEILVLRRVQLDRPDVAGRSAAASNASCGADDRIVLRIGFIA